MRGVLKSIPITFQVIFKDPINFFLFILPTVVSVGLYLLVGVYIYYNASGISDFMRMYLPAPVQNSGFLKILINFFLVISFYVLMNWTYVIVVGILAAPFNDMLSRRIEKKLLGENLSENKSQTWKEMISNLGKTFTNEAKKLLIILFLGIFAVISYYIPPIYFIGLLLSALLFSIQYLDYSWSRHNLTWSLCAKDIFKNAAAYLIPSVIFLAVISIPIVVSLIPTFATAYFTVLWLHRQNKIS